MYIQIYDFTIDEVIEIDTDDIADTYQSEAEGRTILENGDGLFFEVSNVSLMGLGLDNLVNN